MSTEIRADKIEHLTRTKDDFTSWIPEVSLNLFKHFRVRKITLEVDGNDPGQVVQFIYTREGITLWDEAPKSEALPDPEEASEYQDYHGK